MTNQSELADYIRNKRRLEKIAQGYVEYAEIKIVHASKDCQCNGINLSCRHVVRREWRKPRARKGANQ